MKKAALYARVSTPNQEEEGTSLDSQVEAMVAFIEQNEYEAPQDLIFREVWSGTTLERPALEEVRQLARTRNFDALIAYATDRLARNPIHLAIIAEECEKHHIELLFVTEPLDSSPEGQLLRYVRGYAAQIEAEKIRERTIRGKRSRAREGKLPTGGGGLYGYEYDPETGTRAVNREQADVVRMIFQWCVEEQLPLGSICLRLMDMGIPAPKGGPKWSTSTVSRLLRKIDYAGKTYAFRMRSVEPKSHVKQAFERGPQKKTHREARPREEWIELPGATPAIISEELFHAAQRQLKKNADNSSRNRKRQYLLAGHVRCGKCGSRMYSVPRNPDHRYYRCRRRSRIYAPDHPCDARLVNADKIEILVWREVKRALLDPRVITTELEARAGRNGLRSTQEELETVVDRLARLRREEQRVLKLYRYGEYDKALLDAELADIAKERAAWEEEKARLDNRLESQRITEAQKEQIERFCYWASQNIENLTYEDKRLVLDALELMVTVRDGEVSISGVIPRVSEEVSIALQRW